LSASLERGERVTRGNYPFVLALARVGGFVGFGAWY
jgi:hypothetical protein